VLLERIKRRVDFGISAYIDESLYGKLTSQRFRSQWGAPYSFCVHTVLGKLRLLLDEEKKSQERVNVVLEAGHRNIGQVIEQLKRHGWPQLGSVGIDKKMDQPALQAADLLAYSTCEYLTASGKPYLFERVRTTKKPIFLINCTTEYIEEFKASVGDYFKLRGALRRASLEIR
jgi:hypothetical protein